MPRQKVARSREDPEYRLLITPHVTERTQRPTTLFLLETVKAFATFRYELSVDTQVSDDTIHIKVLGFRTPRLSLPSSGSARYEREFEHLDGTYAVTLQGIDGRSNTFTVRFAPGEVEVLKKPRSSFVVLTTEFQQ